MGAGRRFSPFFCACRQGLLGLCGTSAQPMKAFANITCLSLSLSHFGHTPYQQGNTCPGSAVVLHSENTQDTVATPTFSQPEYIEITSYGHRRDDSWHGPATRHAGGAITIPTVSRVNRCSLNGNRSRRPCDRNGVSAHVCTVKPCVRQW